MVVKEVIKLGLQRNGVGRIDRIHSGSGGNALLVEQPTDPVRSLHPGTAVEGVNGGVGDWRLEIGPAVRALVVVVKDELPEHPVEMAFTTDQHPVEALGPRRPDKAFGEHVSPEATVRAYG